ncbi:hypothetical protein H7X68_00675 [Candidatus Saccharibacteria bacterium]|nr:hypothetical protein [Candidatus Saccharibacteria bacterium]
MNTIKDDSSAESSKCDISPEITALSDAFAGNLDDGTAEATVLSIAHALQFSKELGSVFQQWREPGITRNRDAIDRGSSAFLEFYKSHVSEDRKTKDIEPLSWGWEKPHLAVNAVKERLLERWRQEYYLPRSKDATEADLEFWLRGYTAQYGKAAISALRYGSPSFKNAFPDYGPEHRLRISNHDILTVPLGFASIIEAPGTTVRPAIQGMSDTSLILTNDITPAHYKRSIEVPDTLRHIVTNP